MWTSVAKRHHEVQDIFIGAPGSSKLMLYGTVAYEAKDGKKSVKEWAGRANLVKDSADGKWRFQFYQVYLVSVHEII